MEIVFKDESRKSVMRAIHTLTLDDEMVVIEIEGGGVECYEFTEVRKVLALHSKKYDFLTRGESQEDEG